MRPDRATIAYCSRIKECWKDLPIIIGGVEASLRRFAHYDYWSDEVRRSILFDSQADLLVYGMGEIQIRRIAELLAKGAPIEGLKDLRGTVYRTNEVPEISGKFVELPSFEEVVSDTGRFAEAFRMQDAEQDSFHGKTVVQRHGAVLRIDSTLGTGSRFAITFPANRLRTPVPTGVMPARRDAVAAPSSATAATP